MRYSKQRELVMQTVQQLCDHPTAEEIYDKAAQECPNLPENLRPPSGERRRLPEQRSSQGHPAQRLVWQR